MAQTIRDVDTLKVSAEVTVRVTQLLLDPNNKRMSAIEYLAWAVPSFSKTEVRIVIDHIASYLAVQTNTESPEEG